jgi:regulator of sigma E protease
VTVFISIVVFLLLLSVLVLVHELGHFLAARAFGIKVKEFGLGLPPRAIGWKRGETIYSLNWIPLGGFVSLFGEDDQENRGKGSFGSVNRLKRLVVLIAGVTMNFLLGLLVFTVVYARGVDVPTGNILIAHVLPNTPAVTAGIKDGDVVVSAAGKIVHNFSDFQDETKANLGKPFVVVVNRGGSSLTLKVTPRVNAPVGEGAMGVVLDQQTARKTYPFYQAPIEGTKQAVNITYQMVLYLGGLVHDLILGNTKAADQVAGPVGIAYVTYQGIQLGPDFIWQLLGLLSLNLAIVNLLPIPALDGGRIFFVLLSSAMRRDFYPRIEGYIHRFGLLAILLLFILITYNDVVRIFTTTSLGAKVHEIFKFVP